MLEANYPEDLSKAIIINGRLTLPLIKTRTKFVNVTYFSYPSLSKSIYYLLAPKPFTFVFSMVKPFLPPVTLEKINVYGFDKSEWSAALLKEIDADQLPAHYGGTMIDVDGDPKCSSKVRMNIIRKF